MDLLRATAGLKDHGQNPLRLLACLNHSPKAVRTSASLRRPRLRENCCGRTCRRVDLLGAIAGLKDKQAKSPPSGAGPVVVSNRQHDSCAVAPLSEHPSKRHPGSELCSVASSMSGQRQSSYSSLTDARGCRELRVRSTPVSSLSPFEDATNFLYTHKPIMVSEQLSIFFAMSTVVAVLCVRGRWRR